MNLILIGAGGNAGSVIDLIESNNMTVDKIQISDYEKIGEIINGIEINLNDDDVLELLNDNLLLITYAQDMKIRKLIYEKFKMRGANFTSLVSKYSYIGINAQIGVGTIIMPQSSIRNDVIIGENSLINTAAVIEHGCEIGRNCHIGPGSVLTGNVKVGSCTFVGANATILPNIIIGDNCIIGAGSVVTRNVNNNEIWYGNPAKCIDNNGDNNV